MGLSSPSGAVILGGSCALDRWVRLVAGDVGVDLAGPGFDAAGDGLGFGEALIAEPSGDREGAGSVVAEDEDGGVFVELVEGAGGDLGHGDEEGVFEVGVVELPGLADVEQGGAGGGGEELVGLVYGDFEVHDFRISRADGCPMEVPSFGAVEGALTAWPLQRSGSRVPSRPRWRLAGSSGRLAFDDAEEVSGDLVHLFGLGGELFAGGGAFFSAGGGSLG